jgi:hypothetical protein
MELAEKSSLAQFLPSNQDLPRNCPPTANLARPLQKLLLRGAGGFGEILQ